ncbi:MAG TPA: hypothetical protein VEW46_14770 [Pyrinomonadaceae bacterium]|nr:hypothetical protein [Pyrinomonadaceae bacterium]
MTYGCRSRQDPFKFYSEFDNEEESWTNDFAENWQQEVSGKNLDRYVLWLQQSLNKSLNLRLVEDGDFGTRTRNALWTFRRRARLRSSGDVVCVDTERALVAAGANPPPGMVQARTSETTPPALTVYVDIPLQIRLGNAKSMTGIFLPDGFCPLPQVDLIVFLHGFKVRVHKPEFSVSEYWKLREFLLREEVNGSQKNVILVAPTLGPQNQPGSLTCPGGFDNFLDQVLLALKQHGPYAGQQTSPSIRNIILACHSGSGGVMRAIALGSDTSANKIQECWAFEPANMGDASGWKKWAGSRSQNKLYIYYLPGMSGQRLCAALMGRSVPKPGQVSCATNIFAERASAAHDEVPRTHLKDRIQGAPFLLGKSSCQVTRSELGWAGEEEMPASTVPYTRSDQDSLFFETPPPNSLRQSLGRAGQWFRAGGMILVLPDNEAQPDYEMSAIASRGARPLPGRRILAYTTKDVIDNRISVPAQHSLVRLSKNPATNADAVGMLDEIKTGRLAGISCVNWKLPAQRALRLGLSWWTVIPKSEDAVLMLDPGNLLTGPPLIAFRRELDPDCGLLQGEKRFAASPARLDAALLKAGASYKLWRAAQNPDQRTRCFIAPALNGGVLTEVDAPKLDSTRTLNNVVPALLCQAATPASCIETGTDASLSVLLGVPARDLTKVQARDIAVRLVEANLLTIQPPPKFDQTCKVLQPGPKQLVKIQPPIIDRVTFLSLSRDQRTGRVVARQTPMPELDLRLVVLLFDLARFLRLTWGVTEIHHIGVGSSGTHVGRLALDFGGVSGNLTPDVTRFAESLRGPFKLNVLRDWGNKDVEFPAGTCRKGWPSKIGGIDFRDTRYRLDPDQNICANRTDRDSILAFQIFRDIYSFATFHCTDKGTLDPKCKPKIDPQECVRCIGKHPQGPPPTIIGKPSQCIVHPDHPNPGLRAVHLDHIHMEIPLPE